MELDDFHARILMLASEKEEGVSFNELLKDGFTPRTLSKKLLDLQESQSIIRDPKTRKYKTSPQTEKALFVHDLQKFLHDQNTNEQIVRGGFADFPISWHLLKSDLPSELVEDLANDKELISEIEKVRAMFFEKFLRYYMSKSKVDFKTANDKLRKHKAIFIMTLRGFGAYDMKRHINEIAKERKLPPVF